MEKFVHPDGDNSVPYARNDAQNPWKDPLRGFNGGPDLRSPNPAEALKQNDVLNIARATYDVVDYATNYFSPDPATRKCRPIYQPLVSGIVVKANGSLLVNRDMSMGQAMIGGCGVAAYWEQVTLDENLARATSDTGLVVFWDCDGGGLEDPIISGLTDRSDPRNFADNHNLIRGQGANNIRLIRPRLLNSLGAGSANMNSSAIMIYGCQDWDVVDPYAKNCDGLMYVKGTVTRSGVKIPNRNIRIIRPRGEEIRAVGITLLSAHNVFIDGVGGSMASDNNAIIFTHVTDVADHPQDVTIRGLPIASGDIYIVNNNLGLYRNIVIEEVGQYVYQGDTSGITRRPYSATPEPVPAPIPTPVPSVRAPTYTGGRLHVVVDGTSVSDHVQIKEAYESGGRHKLATPASDVRIKTDDVIVGLD